MQTCFRGKTALITGASSGLGAEFARQLAPVAGSLILAARRADRLQSLATELQAAHPNVRVECISCDLSEPEAASLLVAETVRRGLTVDLLVNNAGLGDYGDFADAEWERIQQMLGVNILALTHLTRLLLPGMRQRKQGWVLQVSSIASLVPLPSMAVYAASKAYVTSLTEALRLELKDTGIHVTALCPGPVATEFGSVAQRAEGTRMPSPTFFQVSPERVVRQGLESLAANRPRILPGVVVRCAMLAVGALPMVVIRRILSLRDALSPDKN